MTLHDVVDSVASYQREITVFAPEPSDVLETYFETRHVTVEHEAIPDDGSGGFVVVTDDGEFVGSASVQAVRELVAPDVGGLDTAPNETLQLPLNLLADTTFVAFDHRQLLAASREIEDRAYRQGAGVLRAGFQSLSRFDRERAVYETLSSETDLDVHVYGTPDRSPDVPGVQVHAEDVPEIAACWFVVFDGGTDWRQASALLAEEVETDPGSFRGFWTYDYETVAEIDTYLRDTYD